VSIADSSSDIPTADPRVERIARGLFAHQVEGIAFLLARRRAILADDMGLGKTRQAIVALREAAPAGPYLVVCPASVKRNWAREIVIAAPGHAVDILDGTRGSTTVVAGEDRAPRWTVVNYDILSRRVVELEHVPWSGMVFDEAHYLKNQKSSRSRTATALVGAAAPHSPLVFALTGTPLTNRPRDLFPLLQLLGHPLGRSFLSFAKRYCDAFRNEYGWVTDGASNLDELAVQLHGTMIRRTKTEVLDLPPKLRTWLPVDIDPATGASEMRGVVRLLLESRATRERRRERGRTSNGNGSAPDVAPARSARGRGRGHLLAMLTSARRKLAVAKTAHTIEQVESAVEQGEKVLVFSCFDEPLKKVHAHFADAAVLLTGATPQAQRQTLVDRFQEDDAVRVFVANISAAGVGLNLTAARQVFFNDLDWVPASHWQAEDRAYRIGQTATVNVTYLVAGGTVDDFVQTLLEAKAALVDAVVEGTAIDPTATRDVLTELERILGALSPDLADTTLEDLSDEEVHRLLTDAADRLRAEQAARRTTRSAEREARTDAAFRRAVELLAATLAGPKRDRYEVASGSRPDMTYELTVEVGGDVFCNCPGFEYRGECRHSRPLKSALARGKPVPAPYRKLA
jgi:SWI/SNF-related matrix-associated actin-dependent regulator 1 of chromatin subfamily A